MGLNPCLETRRQAIDRHMMRIIRVGTENPTRRPGLCSVPGSWLLAAIASPWQRGPALIGFPSCDMQNQASRSPPVMVKPITKLLCLGLRLFSIFGFLAAYEPGTHWIWKVIYAALIALSLHGL